MSFIKIKKLRLFLLLFLRVFLFADENPILSLKENNSLWEFGIFNLIGRLPSYRGSESYKTYFLPLPYFIYYGKMIQSDREGLRGIFFQNEVIETDISFSGNPPVDNDISIRKGMDDLDPLIEFGPSLKLFFTDKNSVKLSYLKLSLRGVFSINNNLNINYEGLRGNLNLIYLKTNFLNIENLRLGLNIGIDYSNADFNEYFYDVKESEVTSYRSYYNSKGGYGGFMLSANILHKLNNTFSLGIYFKWENFENVVFEDSPLLTAKNNFIFGLGLIYKIKSN